MRDCGEPRAYTKHWRADSTRFPHREVTAASACVVAHDTHQHGNVRVNGRWNKLKKLKATFSGDAPTVGKKRPVLHNFVLDPRRNILSRCNSQMSKFVWVKSLLQVYERVIGSPSWVLTDAERILKQTTHRRWTQRQNFPNDRIRRSTYYETYAIWWYTVRKRIQEYGNYWRWRNDRVYLASCTVEHASADCFWKAEKDSTKQCRLLRNNKYCQSAHRGEQSAHLLACQREPAASKRQKHDQIWASKIPLWNRTITAVVTCWTSWPSSSVNTCCHPSSRGALDIASTKLQVLISLSCRESLNRLK